MKFSELDLLSVGHSVTLAGAIYQGPDGVLLCFFPDCVAETRGLPVEDLAMDQPEWERFLRQADVLETVVSAREADGTIAKAVARKCERQIDKNVTWRVFKRDGYRCRYCGNDSVPLTVDHLVLWEDGGISTEANMVAACSKCNKVRGNTPYEDWLRHPRYLDLSRRLDEPTRAANAALVGTLDAIPRSPHVRKR